jgi:hypothetical protein
VLIGAKKATAAKVEVPATAIQPTETQAEITMGRFVGTVTRKEDLPQPSVSSPLWGKISSGDFALLNCKNTGLRSMIFDGDDWCYVMPVGNLDVEVVAPVSFVGMKERMESQQKVTSLGAKKSTAEELKKFTNMLDEMMDDDDIAFPNTRTISLEELKKRYPSK